MAAATEAKAGHNDRSMTLHGWTIQSHKEPILSASDADALSDELGIPLPEICFGNNSLRISRRASNGDSDDLSIEWNTRDSLKAVKDQVDLRVAHSDQWLKAQAGTSAYKVQKPFDWTYTTLERGKLTFHSPSDGDGTKKRTMTARQFEKAREGHPGIPLHLLARTDIPIVFFEEVPLFEDELGDNGIAEVVVRVRANESSWFVLSRFFLRVDKVAFRLFDVRTFHSFGSDEIIRDVKGRQATFEQVRRYLPPGSEDDLTRLTDVNWVAGVLERIASGAAAAEGEGGDWEGAGHELEVLQLV